MSPTVVKFLPDLFDQYCKIKEPNVILVSLAWATLPLTLSLYIYIFPVIILWLNKLISFELPNSANQRKKSLSEIDWSKNIKDKQKHFHMHYPKVYTLKLSCHLIENTYRPRVPCGRLGGTLKGSSG